MSDAPISIDDTGNGAASSDAEIARILDEYLAALEAGEPVDPERLLAEHPQLAAQLKRCLEVIHMAGRLMRSDDKQASVDRLMAVTPQFSDYRVIRQLGRGGMGIVYEAEQKSLRRRVALKVLPLASAVDAKQLRRFHIEAQAAAQLHHSHIVPVYAVGCEHGVNFYAMQYIEGKSLAELIRELRQLDGRDAGSEIGSDVPTGNDTELAELLTSGQLSPVDQGEFGADAPRPSSPASGRNTDSSTQTSAYFRTVANLGSQAAEALEHAHQEGVIHRDIKPANIMVDVRGHLWITDFGLARLQNDSNLTISGDLLGTIRYMSPEQAIGRRSIVDQRSDIYALGVTLYELLCLEPAFNGADRREILRQIMEENARPLRVLNPAIPRELETIIGKAMAREPESRYQTAQELADDFRRFLEHRTIKARPPSLLEKGLKWSRRNIAVLIAVAAGLCVTTIILAISAATIAGKQVEVVQQRDAAHRQEEKARRILDELYTGLSERWLAQDPGDGELRREFLEKAAAYYEEFVSAPGRSVEVRIEAAYAWLRIGLICWSLRRIPQGETAYRQAIQRFEDLAAEGRDEVLDAEAYAAYRLGDLLTVAGRKEAAVSSYVHSIALSQSQVARYPRRVVGWVNLAAAQAGVASVRRDEAAFRETERIYRKVISGLAADQFDLRFVLEELSKHRIIMDTPFPGMLATLSSHEEARRWILAGAYVSFGISLEDQGRYLEAEDCYRHALDAFPPQDDGRSYRQSRPRSLTLRIYAGTLYRAGRYRDAIRAYRDALTLQPNETKADEGLAILLANCPDPAFRDPKEAIRLARRGLDLRPKDGHLWQALGISLFRAGEWDEARSSLDRSVSLRGGGDAEDKLFLAMTHWKLGHIEEARRWYAQGVQQLVTTAHADVQNPLDTRLESLRAEAAALLSGTQIKSHEDK